jgi:hypothetical protein
VETPGYFVTIRAERLHAATGLGAEAKGRVAAGLPDGDG